MSAVAEFIGAMEAAGVKPGEPISDMLKHGELIRFHVDGDRAGRKNGWAVLYLDGTPAGSFGSYRAGVSEKWRSGERPSLSPAERREQRKKWEADRDKRRAELAQRQEDAATRAVTMWDGADAVDLAHAYLTAKGVSGEGVGQSGSMVLIPMRDAEGRLWNIQRIWPDGTKLFLKGGRTDGLFWLCGEPDAVVCIGEGYGTMARVRRATGHAVVATFTEKNLLAVARSIAAQYPDADYVICADDDAQLIDHPTIKRNVGLDAANAAAAAVGGRVAMPPRKDA